MHPYFDPRDLDCLRTATAVALGHHRVPADESRIEDLVWGLVGTNWSCNGSNCKTWGKRIAGKGIECGVRFSEES
ncbi:MAG: hypothetical protein EA424_02050 [Planctomycetaceae bacterium]|nr:MAG: hypothetical protein EA424_02050 [Planctomycetaceae bacterium]